MDVAGDALARMTWNYYPSLLHRPSVRLMREGMQGAPDVQPRISTPFFLRPRGDALLGAVSLNSPVLRAAGCTQQAAAEVGSQSESQSLTAVPVWDHLWPRRATFFPPRMDHLFSVDHLFSTLYRNAGPPEIF